MNDSFHDTQVRMYNTYGVALGYQLGGGWKLTLGGNTGDIDIIRAGQRQQQETDYIYGMGISYGALVVTACLQQPTTTITPGTIPITWGACCQNPKVWKLGYPINLSMACVHSSPTTCSMPVPNMPVPMAAMNSSGSSYLPDCIISWTAV